MSDRRRKGSAQTASGAEEHAYRSESLLDAQDYASAALEAERALDCLPLMARAAPHARPSASAPGARQDDRDRQVPDSALLDEVWSAFMLSAKLDSTSEEAIDELASLQKLRADLPPPATPTSVISTSAAGSFDVIIVGAGAAGVGTALMLTKTFGLDASRVLLIERGEAVGDTFRRWPAEMRCLL